MLKLSLLNLVLLLAANCCFAVTINTHEYGAVGDGKTDDTTAFQKALDEAAKEGASVVFAPKGEYLIAGTIVVRPNTTLKGEYSGPAGNRGTILLATGGKGRIDGKGCIYMQGGSSVTNISIRYPEQVADADRPIPYPYAITMDGYTRLEEIFLLNPYLGITTDGAHANMIRNVWGEPLKTGINANHIHDISRIENVHFWPYYTNDKPKLREWVQQNGIAFQFGRSDWQYVVNTFCYGYHTGYRFYHTEAVKDTPLLGGTTNGNFVGIGADRCVIGIDVEDSFNIGISIVNGEFAPFGASDSQGVWLRKGNTGNLTLVNCSFWAIPNVVAQVEDGSLNMSACNVQEWALHRPKQPAFVLTGGRLNVNGCTFNQNGYLASLDGKQSKALFTANMGQNTLTVLNKIGARAVFGANNPSVTLLKASPETGK